MHHFLHRGHRPAQRTMRPVNSSKAPSWTSPRATLLHRRPLCILERAGTGLQLPWPPGSKRSGTHLCSCRLKCLVSPRHHSSGACFWRVLRRTPGATSRRPTLGSAQCMGHIGEGALLPQYVMHRHQPAILHYRPPSATRCTRTTQTASCNCKNRLPPALGLPLGRQAANACSYCRHCPPAPRLFRFPSSFRSRAPWFVVRRRCCCLRPCEDVSGTSAGDNAALRSTHTAAV
jgi:hypothetical protein